MNDMKANARIVTDLESPQTFSANNARQEYVVIGAIVYRFTLDRYMCDVLAEICRREQSSFQQVCEAVAHTKEPAMSIEQGLVIFVIDYFRLAATNEGHLAAEHGQDPMHSSGETLSVN